MEIFSIIKFVDIHSCKEKEKQFSGEFMRKMDINKEITCRLCLNNFTDCNVEVIGKFAIEALHLLLLNLNLNVSWEPAMCSTCSNWLKKCFDFKSNCLRVEDSVRRFVDKGEITLLEVYKDIYGNLAKTNLEDNKICRFCCNIAGNNFKSLKADVTSDMVQEYMPELNLNISSDPILCTSCLDSFRNYVTFLSNCSSVEKEIIKYIDAIGYSPDGYIKLIEVARFAQQNLDSFTDFNNKKIQIKVEMPLPEEIKSESPEENFIDCGKIQISKHSDEEACTESFEDQKCEPAELLLADVKKEYCDMLEESDEGCFRNDNFNFERATTEVKCEPQDPNSFETSPVTKYEDTAFPDSEERHSVDRVPTLYVTVSEVKKEVMNQPQKEAADNTLTATEEKYQCDICSYRTIYKASLTRHLQKHKDQSVTEMEGAKKCPTKRSDRPDAPTFKCDSCEYKTTRKFRLKEHRLIHMDPSEVQLFKCEQCDFKSKWKNTLRKHSLLHKNSSEVPTYSCDFCEYTCKAKSYLVQHLLIHKDGLTHKCNNCSYETKYKSYLMRHLIVHKNESEIYKCTECQFKTYSEVTLSKHAARHTDTSKIRSFKCDVCGYSSNRRSRMKEHMVTHQDPAEVRIYECDQCTFRTKWRCTYNKHRLVHDESYQMPVYSCEFCEYKATCREHLNKHSIVHKDSTEIDMQRCEVCGFETKRKQYLRSHMLTHVDLANLEEEGGAASVQVFECDVCQYKTKRKWQLVRHMARHRKPSKAVKVARMYKCDVCQFETKWAQSLKVHMMTHK